MNDISTELERPNEELGDQPCFKCVRAGLNTASIAHMEEGKGLCVYHHYGRRWGVTMLAQQIHDGAIIHPTDHANRKRTEQ